MSFLALIFLFHVLVFYLQNSSTLGEQICNTLSCGDILIQFPFGLKEANQDPGCSYFPSPSFQLSCNNQSQTILTLPYSKDLVVKSINYEAQSIKVNDPNGCLPNRFLHDWNLSGSPFKLNPSIYEILNFTFLSCPSNMTKSSPLPLPPIFCMTDEGNSKPNSSFVIVSWSPPIDSSTLSQPCEVISSALVPVERMEMPMWPLWPDLNSDVGLVWTEPRCGNCVLSGQVCSFSKDKSFHQVACFPSSSGKGVSRSVKYGIAIGVGIPGLLCLIGFSCFICGKVTQRRRSMEFPTTISLEPIPFVMGLDGDTIEKYPKTLIGESGRLLKPNDNTCAICLSEYEPKETLRSIPECNHYFHADCIDEWLKMNGTCPICRNSPEASSTFTPPFSSSSPTSSLSPSQ